MNHKTDMQAVLLDAMRVISESADEIKAGCAIDDEWPDAEDKAEYDWRVAVLESVRSLASRPDAQANEARAADPGEELQGWSVTVERNGVRLLTIEKDSVGGVENIGDFAPLVRDCAEHLLSFIGRDAQADKSGAATTPDAIRSLQRLEAACDQRAALLTPEASLAAEKAPGMREALYELDMARREACEVLARAAASQTEVAQAIATAKLTCSECVASQPQAAEPKGLIEAIEALQCPETHSCSNPELFERGWEVGRGAALDVARAILAKGE